jgi:hypothetical protein
VSRSRRSRDARACRKISHPAESLYGVIGDWREQGEIHEVETVRCLECARLYGKPTRGGTVRANPGCPHCGYVGWLSAAIPFTREIAPLRSVEDRQRLRSA